MNVSEVCNICNKSSDQMLMLSCIHDPCLDCAAASFAFQLQNKNTNPEIYGCQICGEQTALDSSTVQQLASFANALLHRRKSIKNPQSQSHIRNKSNTNRKHQTSSNVHPLGTNSYKKSHNKHQNLSPHKKATSISNPITYFCKEHPEEEITYYCFNCEINICPECAIHGDHHDHKVKLIKKAIPDVKGEYLEIVNRIGSSQNMMTKGKDLFLKEIKDINERYSREKNYIHKQFQVLKDCLVKKQKQLLRVLERINKDNIQTLTGFLEEINSNYEEVTKVKKSIELILRKDEVLIFQEYRNIGGFEMRVEEVRKDSQTIGGDITVLDTGFIDQQISRTSESISHLREGVKRQTICMQGFYPKENRLNSQNNFRQSNIKESSIRESKVSQTDLQRKIKKYID